MRVLLIAGLSAAFSIGCTFGVKTCSSTDPCLAGGQCVQGVCTVPINAGGGGAEDPDSGIDAGTTGGGTGGGGGGDAGPFDAGPLVGLVFLTPPRIGQAGACSEVVQIGVFEDAGSSQLGLISANEDALFFSDPACAGPAGLFFDIPSSSVVSIYFKSTAVGSVLVGAFLADVAGESVNQVQSIVGGEPVQLLFGGSATLRAGACSPPLSVQVRDEFGNNTPVLSDLEVSLTSNSATTRFFAQGDSTCQTPLVPAAIRVSAGQSSGFFRFVDTTPGMPVFDAAGGDAGVEGPNVLPASQEQTVL